MKNGVIKGNNQETEKELPNFAEQMNYEIARSMNSGSQKCFYFAY